jgi:hypothetical protein
LSANRFGLAAHRVALCARSRRTIHRPRPISPTSLRVLGVWPTTPPGVSPIQIVVITFA